MQSSKIRQYLFTLFIFFGAFLFGFAPPQSQAALTDDISPSFEPREGSQADNDGDTIPDSIDLDDDNDGIPDEIECVEATSSLPLSVINGSFENPDIDSSAELFQNQWGAFPLVAVTYLESDVPGWQTTSTDNKIEVWQKWFGGMGTFHGEQFAEINATQDAALYQDVETTPGSVMEWSFAHSGRAGDDTIELLVGPPDGPYTSLGEFTSPKMSWREYSGEYTVPAGQTVTRFMYNAVSTGSGNNTIGNFLDDIRFAVQSTSCTLDSDEDGILNIFDLDSDNDGLPDNVEAQLTSSYLAPGTSVNPDGFLVEYPAGLNPVDTDGDGTPDYLDNDSDDDQIDDTTEAGLTLQGTVGNNGLDSNIEAADDYSDPNGTINDTTALPDVNSDLNVGGDVDFRQPNMPALVVTLSSDQYVLEGGETIQYELMVENVGTGTASDLVAAGSLTDNQSYSDGATGNWVLGSLAPGEKRTVTFTTAVGPVEIGKRYLTTVTVVGEDQNGDPIVKDQSRFLPTDIDATDSGEATAFGGPLSCSTEETLVAYEDLKNQGWSDWDYNDLIIHVQAEICSTPLVSNVSTAGCSIDFEAETGDLTGFSVINSGDASAGAYIEVPDSGARGRNAWHYAQEDRKAVYTFTTEVDAYFEIYASSKGVDTMSDSFWYRYDDGHYYRTNVPRETDKVSGFQDHYFQKLAGSNQAENFLLEAGTHTLTIYNREDGAALDKFRLECDPIQPEFVPQTMATATVTYTVEARGAGYEHALKHTLPFVDGGQLNLTNYDGSGNQISFAAHAFDEGMTVTIFENSHVAMPSDPSVGVQANTLTEQGDAIPGHSAVLELIVSDYQNYPVQDLPPLPWDLYIEVLTTGEEVHLLQPGYMDNTQTVNTEFDANAPLESYDMPLAFEFDKEWEWPVEFFGIWKAYPEFEEHVKTGYRHSEDWYYKGKGDPTHIWSYFVNKSILGPVQQTEPTSRYFASPVAVDLDGDGVDEIIIGDLLSKEIKVFAGDKTLLWSDVLTETNTLYGDQYEAEAGIKAAVTVADLDNDDDLEIIFGAENGYLYAYHHDGTQVSGFPFEVADAKILAAPAVANFDTDDDELEIIVPLANGQLYTFNHDGTQYWPWTGGIGYEVEAFGNQSINSSPTYGDLDEDGDLEIVVGSTDNKLYVYHHDATLYWTFETGDDIVSTPLVADIDPEMPGLEILFGSGDGYVYLLDQLGELLWKQETGWTVRSSAILVEMDGDEYPEIVIGSDDDKIYAWHYWGYPVEGWPKAAGGDLFSTPTAGDIDEDGELEIVIGSDDARVYAWNLDGTPVYDWPKETAASVKGAVTVSNVDQDVTAEIVAADFDGEIYIWGAAADQESIFIPMVVR